MIEGLHWTFKLHNSAVSKHLENPTAGLIWMQQAIKDIASRKIHWETRNGIWGYKFQHPFSLINTGRSQVQDHITEGFFLEQMGLVGNAQPGGNQPESYQGSEFTCEY